MTKGSSGRSRSSASRREQSRRLRVHVQHSASTVPSQRWTAARVKAAARFYPGMLDLIHLTYGDAGSDFDAALATVDILVSAGNIDLTSFQARAPRLRWIQSTSAGVDKIVSLIPPGVILTNARGVHGPRGGEYGMTAILMLNSRVPQFATNQRMARWVQLQTTPVAGKTVVLLGVGSIGSVVARLAKRFGMHVLGVSRNAQPNRWVDRMVGPQQLSKVLPKADFVIATLPLTPETQGLIGAMELDLLPPHAGIANLGRAGVIDYDALTEKLRKHELSGAVLDVFYEEPLPPDAPLWSVPNLIISPHCAVDDGAVYVERCLAIFFENLKRFVSGRPLRNVVDTRLGY